MIRIPPPLGGRYTKAYNKPKRSSPQEPTQQGRDLKITGACCASKKCRSNSNCNCGCGNGQPRYSANTPGAGSGQSATMMMPNIVINVQSGNRRSSDYTDMHSADTQYSPSEANPYTFAPSTTENNPTTSSFEHGGHYSSRYGAISNEPEASVMPQSVSQPSQEQNVLPIVLSPRAKQRVQQINPGLPPEYVGRRYPKEFP